MDIAAFNSQHRDFSADMITYRTHNVQTGDINMLSEQTAAACTVQDVRGNTMSQSSSGGTDRENIGLRSEEIT